MSTHPGQPSSWEAKNGAQKDEVSSRTILILIALGAVLHTIRWMLLPFVVSGVVAYLCTPVVEKLAARTRSPRALIATGVFFILLAFALSLGLLGLPPLVRQLMRLVTDLQGTLENLTRSIIGNQTINMFGEPMNAAQLAQSAAAGVRGWISSGQVVTLGTIASAGLFGMILTLVLLFYFLLSGPAIARGIFWLVPVNQRKPVQAVWTRLDPLLRRYFIGVILILAYASVAAYLGLGLVLGIKHAVFLAVMTGALEFIPVIGPAASAAIAGLVALRYATGIGSILGYAAYAAALRLSIDQLVAPIVLGAAARLRPPVIIFCFLAGAVLFGAAGVILAVPAALTIKVTLATLRGEPLAQGVDAHQRSLPPERGGRT
jgi:predicted PurR-regulated permease PerM